jgi:hypothetical protein
MKINNALMVVFHLISLYTMSRNGFEKLKSHQIAGGDSKQQPQVVAIKCNNDKT